LRKPQAYPWICRGFSQALDARALHNATFFRQARKAKILTVGIHWVFRGLKFEACRRITEKWQLCKALMRKRLLQIESKIAQFRFKSNTELASKGID
jgi:hypothetical protein